MPWELGEYRRARGSSVPRPRLSPARRAADTGYITADRVCHRSRSLRRRVWRSAAGRNASFFHQYLVGDAECFDTGRHPGVDGNLQERLANFLGRAPITQGPADVELELLSAIQGGENAEVVEASLLPAEPVTAPDCTPAVLGQEPLEVPVEVVDVPNSSLDVIIAQNGATDLEPALVELL